MKRSRNHRAVSFLCIAFCMLTGSLVVGAPRVPAPEWTGASRPVAAREDPSAVVPGEGGLPRIELADAAACGHRMPRAVRGTRLPGGTVVRDGNLFRSRVSGPDAVVPSWCCYSGSPSRGVTGLAIR